MLQLLLINLYYVIYYFYQRWAHAEKVISRLALKQVTQTNNVQQNFMVHALIRSFPIPVQEIAYFYRYQGHVFLRPLEGEDQLISQSLHQVEEVLDAKLFFRVARHMIANHMAIVDYRSLSFGKLELTLSLPYRESARVSKVSAHNFPVWMER